MAVALFVVGLVQRIDLANATGFGYGDPIDVSSYHHLLFYCFVYVPGTAQAVDDF